MHSSNSARGRAMSLANVRLTFGGPDERPPDMPEFGDFHPTSFLTEVDVTEVFENDIVLIIVCDGTEFRHVINPKPPMGFRLE